MNYYSRVKICGGGGIRTPGGYKPSLVFKTSAFSQALPPLLNKNLMNVVLKFNYLFLTGLNN